MCRFISCIPNNAYTTDNVLLTVKKAVFTVTAASYEINSSCAIEYSLFVRN